MVVYMTINLINKKRYIGKDVKNKKSYLGSGTVLTKAIKKYGKENFKKITLEECTDRCHLENREVWWIDFFDAVKSEDFYNLQDGGVGGAVFGHTTSEETKDKIRKSLTGRKRPKEVVKKLYKPILQYDLKGDFLKEFESKKKAEESIKGRLGAVPKNKPKFSRGYFFIWKESCNFEKKIKVKNAYQTLRVGRFDKNELQEEFENLSIAIKKYENDHIREVCKGKRKTACGYVWKFI